MSRQKSEYERALSIANQKSSIFQIQGGKIGGEGIESILLSGISKIKLNLLLERMEQARALPTVVVTDPQSSGLAALLRKRQGANFSFVRCDGESAYYHFLRHKSEWEMLRFFSQTAAEYGLFGQQQAEAETLLRGILQLSSCGSDIFSALAEERLTSGYLSNEIAHQHRRKRLSGAECAVLRRNMNLSIGAVQNVSRAFRGLFAVLANMRGIPFSMWDILEQHRSVCFCLDRPMTVHSPCWYLAKMLQYDLYDCLIKTQKPFLLVLDMSDKEKLALFSSLIGGSQASVILNVNNAEYLTGKYSVSCFSEIYVFSHMDIESVKYWSDFFSTHRVAEYTYTSHADAANRCPFLPASFGELFASPSKEGSISRCLVDRPIFEINEIRELDENEFIYLNRRDRKPRKLVFR